MLWSFSFINLAKNSSHLWKKKKACPSLALGRGTRKRRRDMVKEKKKENGSGEKKGRGKKDKMEEKPRS